MDDLDNYKEELNNFHERAMNLAEEAFFLTRDGKEEEAFQKFHAAFRLEKVVADYLIESKQDVKDIEPSRTIICLSCANLANDAGLTEEANKYSNKVIEFNLYKECVDEAMELINKK